MSCVLKYVPLKAHICGFCLLFIPIVSGPVPSMNQSKLLRDTAYKFETSLQGLHVGEEMSQNTNLASAISIKNVSVEIKHCLQIAVREEINLQIKMPIKILN